MAEQELLKANIESIAHEQRSTKTLALATKEIAKKALLESKNTKKWVIIGVLINISIDIIKAIFYG